MFRSSTIIRELVLCLVKVMLEPSVKLCPCRLCGGVAACLKRHCLNSGKFKLSTRWLGRRIGLRFHAAVNLRLLPHHHITYK
jgi:hypothetical protein